MNAPVQLKNYRIQKISFEVVQDFEAFDPEDAPYSIDVDYDIFSYEEDPLQYSIDLLVKVIPQTDEEMFLPYDMELMLQGMFYFDEEVDEDEKSFHLNISCTSMLYGSAREIIHQLTGRSSYGVVTIPSVQFAKIAEAKADEEEE